MADWLPDRLPEDPEAERALLATCCAPGAERVAGELAFQMVEEDFVHPGHRAVFKAFRTLVEGQIEINAITLKDALEQAGELGRIGGFQGLVELLASEEVGRPEVLADLLARKRKQRELIRLGASLVRQAAEEPPEQLIEQMSGDLTRLQQGTKEKAGLEHIHDVSIEAMNKFFERIEGRGTPGLPVGFNRLDAITQGFQPGQLIILAARPGIGKTALALNFALRASVQHDAHCAFLSLEMGKEEVFNRLLSAHASINMKAVQAGAFDAHIQARILEARDDLVRRPLFISDQATITVREIANMVERHLSRANQRLDMLVVDYLQLVSSPADSRGAKQSEAVRVGEISRGFKLMAKDYGIPVVVLSQLNREVEHRQGGLPQLSDLRDSGSIEQDADMVMFIHRKMRPVVEGEEEDKSAQLVLAKHRNGPTGIVPLYFEGEFARYRELERSTDEEY